MATLASEALAAPPPSAEPERDITSFVRIDEDGLCRLDLLVENMTCGACIRAVEGTLEREGGLEQARVNFSTRRLAVAWKGDPARANRFARVLAVRGYPVVPFDSARLDASGGLEERQILRALAIAGFAAGNVMLLAVSVWAGHAVGMGDATRTLLHWFQALLALPAIALAGQPFFRSAWSALRHGRTNMDVPISLAVIIAPAMSLLETIHHGQHAYFDSAVTLLFFLLIGRYLDRRARGRAREAALRLVALQATAATVLRPDGTTASVPVDRLAPGTRLLVATGERIAADGRLAHGVTELDTSLISGESVPQPAAAGAPVFAGTINRGAPIEVEVTAAGERTLLAEIVRLMETAEQAKSRFVAIADRVARLYSPVVHTLAAITFAFWTLWGGLAWQPALLIAVAVLIVTCPCALGLAVPVVQVVASGRLLRRGVLLKSATALERLAEVDTVVFDKTGTLTEGTLQLVTDGLDPDALSDAASLAVTSRHPLARAVAAACPTAPSPDVEEVPGCGLRHRGPDGETRLGRRGWAADLPEDTAPGAELVLARPGHAPVVLRFVETARADAAEVIAGLARLGLTVELLSGDREPTVRALAGSLGIAAWQAGLRPADKVARLEELRAQGRKVLMVGDGLNDAPALAAAHASISPASAVDIAQTAADAVFQGGRLAPVLDIVTTARRSQAIVRQNIAASFAYNLVAVPVAMAGLVTPLLAAVFMSASSLVVIGNALRLARR
jgi:Cu2+-exporting ATPase